MDVVQIDLNDRARVRDFLALPFRLYSKIPQWVPPLEGDIRLMLTPKRHPFYRHSAAAFFSAYRAGSDSRNQIVGRIAVLNNRAYNDYNHSKSAFFYLFESENDPEVASGLFEAAFAWARARGLTEMLGPKGFTLLDGFGMLARGFEHRPAFGLPYNPAYYLELVKKIGFETQGEAVSGYLDPAMQFPPRIHELSERLQKRRGLRIARYKTRADLRTLVPHLKALYNGALEGTTGTYPLSDVEADSMASQLLWFADPRLVKVVMKGEQPVGFLLAYPDVSAALQKTKGKLFPFGWLVLLWELRYTDRVNINGVGMLPEYRGSGGTAILFSEMYKTIREAGRFKHAELVQIGVENDPMQRELRDLGVDFYKTHRIYRKDV